MGEEKTKKNDFIEIGFTGKVKNGEVFDTNIPEEAKKIGLEINKAPFILCVGQEMVIKGLDKELENKELEKEYLVDLLPKDAFQERKSSLVKLIPLNVFTQQKISPRPGMTFALDNMLVKVVSVSGGRVLCDFNNPLAGKVVTYKFKIKRKVDDLKEKSEAVAKYFLGKEVKLEIEENKINIECEEFFKPLIDMINSKFRDILKAEFVIKKGEEKKDEKEEKEDEKEMINNV